MNRLIIVEGMDNTGKSTLIQELIRTVGRGTLAAKVSLGPFKSSLEQLKWTYNQIKKAEEGKDLIIYDRFLPICDIVYGTVLRDNKTIWTLDSAELKALREVNPLIIFCNPGIEKILETMDEREQLEGVPENARVLLAMYKSVIYELESLGFEVHYYDYTCEASKQDIYGTVANLVKNFNDIKGGN